MQAQPTTHTSDTSRRSRVSAGLAIGLDVAVYVVFVLAGKRTHHTGFAPLDYLAVFLPMTVGYLAAAFAFRLYDAPLDWRRAVPAWLFGASLGYVLRTLVRWRALEPTFALVTLGVLAVLLLGWRVVAVVVTRPRKTRSA